MFHNKFHPERPLNSYANILSPLKHTVQMLHTACSNAPTSFSKSTCFNPLPTTQLSRDRNGYFVSQTATWRGERLNACNAFGCLKWWKELSDPALLAAARDGNINQILPWASLESGEGGGGGRGVCWDRAPPRGSFTMGCMLDAIHCWAPIYATTTANILTMTWWGEHLSSPCYQWITAMENGKKSLIGSQCNRGTSLSVFITESSAQHGHCHEESGYHQRCVWIYETAASGAGWMGKIYPSVLWAPTGWPGIMQMPLPCKPLPPTGIASHTFQWENLTLMYRSPYAEQ